MDSLTEFPQIQLSASSLPGHTQNYALPAAIDLQLLQLMYLSI